MTTPPTDSSYWVKPQQLLAGAYPGALAPEAHRAKIKALLAAGVNVFVSLMEAGETNANGAAFVAYEDCVQADCPQAICMRFPIRDRFIPTEAEMSATLDAVDQFIEAGKTVYVHCWGGVGRTGTVVACWLLRHQLATRENVLTKLTELRQQDVERGYRESPENQTQVEFVYSWIKTQQEH